MNLQKSMKNSIVDILCSNKPSIYLYGSLVLDDFKLGWSDIDILCLTQTPMTDTQTSRLVNLRQELSEEYKGNKYFRSFEGEISLLEAFKTKSQDSVVYWGSSGQRINEISYFDVFGTMELLDYGILLYGEDIRDQIKYPTDDVVKAKIIHHYDAIRKHAQKTGSSILSAGWLLDIARCLYTLRTGKIIAKTKAGEWAIENNLAPDAEILKKAVEIRKQPLKYKEDNSALNWSKTLGEYIQRFADVLERELIGTLYGE